MIDHHVWCTEAGNIIEGSCRQCEELARRYPAQGSLDYTDMFREYFLEIKEGPHESIQDSSKI